MRSLQIPRLLTALAIFTFLCTTLFPFSQPADARSIHTALPHLPLGLTSLSTVPVVARNQDGRLSLFAYGDDSNANRAILEDYQLPNGSGGWSGWHVLPSSIPGEYIQFTNAPGVGQDSDGRLELFAETMGGAVYNDYQVSPNGPWAGWRIMPASNLGTVTGVPGVGSDQDGRLEVFVISKPKGVIQHIWQSSAGKSWVSKWANFPDAGFNGPEGVSVGQDTDGRLEIFAGYQPIVADVRQLYSYYQTSPNGGWSSLHALGSVPGGVNRYQSVNRTSDGSLFVVVNDGNSNIDGDVQACAGCGWQGFFSLGGVDGGTATVAANQDGRLEIFAPSGNGSVYHKWQDCPGHCGWSGWSSLGGSLAGIPAVGMNGFDLSGTLDVFSLDNNATMEQQWQNGPNGSGGWSGWHTM